MVEEYRTSHRPRIAAAAATRSRRLPVVLVHDFGAGKIHRLGGPAVVLFDFIVTIAAFLGIAAATRCVTGAGSEGKRFSRRRTSVLVWRQNLLEINFERCRHMHPR